MVQEITEEEQKLLLKKACEAQQNSYSPYSKFRVGAALLLQNGQLFGGTNVENASYGATICAERSAICAAMSAVGPSQMKVKAAAVVTDLSKPASPCGMCRQVLAEFGDFPVFLHARNNGKCKMTSVHELLPMAFTPNHLAEYQNQLSTSQN